MITSSRPKSKQGSKLLIVMRYRLLICLLLTGCSSVWVDTPAPLPDREPVGAPSQTAIQQGVNVFVKDAKLKQPFEVSAARRTDRGPGQYYVCLREVNATAERSRYVFSVFFNNEDYKGSRQSVIMEDCENQLYNPIQIVATEPHKG